MKTLRAVFVVLVGLVGSNLWAAEQPTAGLPRIGKREIAVKGAVGKPGIQVLPGEAGREQTLAAALTRAAGFTRYADIRRVRVLRMNARGEVVQTFVLNAAEQMEKDAKHFELVPGDVVFVDERD